MAQQSIPWRCRLPSNVDPLTAFILCKTGGPTASRRLEADANLGHDTIRRSWLYKYPRTGPNIHLLLRCIDALGYEIIIRPKRPSSSSGASS